ncbi:hypothetical protein FIBSPDRAFT_399332 [Athelia psychrophila]|uniref:Uncharacterized protein n=1 Tax=Athelia psychrophila TaxID=1759441 RepID=A0A166NEM7_9AGAM|nr:hypothetical protein FIBSPDRAFT_399332 [Fibularhizoctonia sp. CBS 109695]
MARLRRNPLPHRDHPRHSLPLAPPRAIVLPLNHIAGKSVVRCQEGLMKRRDERVGLMNGSLGSIRMVKFIG